MLAHTARIAVVAALVVAVLSQTYAQGPPAAAPPAQGMVVLRNGEVIAGKVTKADDGYLVDLPHGRIRLKQADVEAVCGSLEEAYRLKKAAMLTGNIQDHLGLAQWCLRHNLFEAASAELADAKAADPQNPMIAALQHRMKMAQEPPPPAAARKNLAAAGPSNEDLDRMMRGLPRGAVESFTQSVQPVLLNHCTTSGCHASQGDSGFRLHRLTASSPSSRRTTQRNLYAALKFIDLGNPSQSRLLTATTAPHGTVEHAIFTQRQAMQYQHIADWVSQMAGRPLQESPASVARRAPAEFDDLIADETPPGALRESNEAPSLGAAERRRTSRGAGAPGKTTGAATPASYDQAADPHDPEVFNRRHGRDKAPDRERDKGPDQGTDKPKPPAPPKKKAPARQGPLQELLPLREIQGQ